MHGVMNDQTQRKKTWSLIRFSSALMTSGTNQQTWEKIEIWFLNFAWIAAFSIGISFFFFSDTMLCLSCLLANLIEPSLLSIPRNYGAFSGSNLLILAVFFMVFTKLLLISKIAVEQSFWLCTQTMVGILLMMTNVEWNYFKTNPKTTRPEKIDVIFRNFAASLMEISETHREVLEGWFVAFNVTNNFSLFNFPFQPFL